jgi:hypothetical protein
MNIARVKWTVNSVCVLHDLKSVKKSLCRNIVH